MSDDSVENVSSGANPGLEVSVDEVEEGAPTWVTTFADLMSLLLTFFVGVFFAFLAEGGDLSGTKTSSCVW